jgi:hypothetical protein
VNNATEIIQLQHFASAPLPHFVFAGEEGEPASIARCLRAGYSMESSDDMPLDPLGRRILESSLSLLQSKDKITVKEICDALDIGDAAARRRLTQIVELNQLDLLPGTGRIPSFYCAPGNATEPDQSKLPSAFEALLTKIVEEEEAVRQQIEQLQTRLNELALDRGQAEAAVDLSQKYSSKVGGRNND